MSLLNDPALREAESSLQSVQLSPLCGLSLDFLAALFHEVVHERLGQRCAMDRFMTGKNGVSPSRMHAITEALRRWIQTQLNRSSSAAATPASADDDAASSSSSSSSTAEAATAVALASLTSLGVGSAESAALLSAYRAREPELLAHAKSLSVTQLAEWSLRDFDWNARVTLASSALANLRIPTVQLSLILAPPAGSSTSGVSGVASADALKKVALELDSEGLDAVLAEMERINATVQAFSTTQENNVIAV